MGRDPSIFEISIKVRFEPAWTTVSEAFFKCSQPVGCEGGAGSLGGETATGGVGAGGPGWAGAGGGVAAATGGDLQVDAGFTG